MHMEPRKILLSAILAMAAQDQKPGRPFRLALRKSIMDHLTDRDIAVLEEKYNIIMERRDDVD